MTSLHGDAAQYAAQAALQQATRAVWNAVRRFLLARFLRDARGSRTLAAALLQDAQDAALRVQLEDVAADMADAGEDAAAARLGCVQAAFVACARTQYEGIASMRAKAARLNELAAELVAATPEVAGRVVVRRAEGPLEVWSIVRETKTFWWLDPVRHAPGTVVPQPQRVSKTRSHAEGWRLYPLPPAPTLPED